MSYENAYCEKAVTWATKNIQIIDGANNCTYSIFSTTEKEFLILFPEPGQDIEFIEDAVSRHGEKKLAQAMRPIWARPVKKPKVSGIHGTLFYGLYWKKKYYPTKKDGEMVIPL